MNNDYNNNWQNNGYPPASPQGPQPGQGLASGSLVCGITSLVLSIMFGWTTFLALVGMVIGIVGIVLAVNAKKKGNTTGTQTAGLVLSIIGACLSCIVFVSCIACICIGIAAASSFDYGSFDFDSFFNSISA